MKNGKKKEKKEGWEREKGEVKGVSRRRKRNKEEEYEEQQEEEEQEEVMKKKEAKLCDKLDQQDFPTPSKKTLIAVTLIAVIFQPFDTYEFLEVM